MRRMLAVGAVFLSLLGGAARAEQPWLRLPPTPNLPKPELHGTLAVNGAPIFYAVYGKAHAQTVVLLHGGLANSAYWGLLIPQLARTSRVLVVDSRGHGRSGRSAAPFGYDLMASDVLGVMDGLHIAKAALVGWSDGAIIGLDIAMHHPERLTRLFAFAANSDPSGNKDVRLSPVFTAYIVRAQHEYTALNPTPGDFAGFDAAIEKMWSSEPHWRAADLGRIHVPVWIVDGDHDEAIKRENTDFMATAIPGARELILPGTSHFAFLQDPAGFNWAVEHWLSAPTD